MLETLGQTGLPSFQNEQILNQQITRGEAQSSSEKLTAQVYAFLVNARVLNANGDHDLALNLLRQACNLQSHPVILKELSQTLVAKKSMNEAYTIVTKWCALFPGFDSSFMKAQVEYELGQDEKSLQSYFETMAFVEDERPQLFDIFKNVGNIHVRKGDFESAEEFYNKAYALNSRSDILYVNYGILEMQRGELDKAKDRFRTAIHINSRNDKAWTSLAMVHFEFGDEELGAANIKKALDLNPMNKTALSFAYQKMTSKKFGEFVIEALQNYLDKADFDEEVSCLLIQKFHERGCIDLAILECQRLLLWNPLEEKYFNLLAELEGAQE